MSLQNFHRALFEAKYGRNDKNWFPKWLKRYASFLKEQHRPKSKHQDASTVADEELPINVELAVRFCKILLTSKTPAWQRLQAVRALEAYQAIVLGIRDATFHSMKVKLGELAHRERLDRKEKTSSDPISA